MRTNSPSKNTVLSRSRVVSAIGLILMLAASVLVTSIVRVPAAEAAGPPYSGPQTAATGPAYFGPAPNPIPYCESPTYLEPFADNITPRGRLAVGDTSTVSTNGIDMELTITAEGDPGGQYPGFFPAGGEGAVNDQPKGVEMASDDRATITLSEPLFYSQWIFTDVDRANEGFFVTPAWTETGQVAIFAGDPDYTFAGTSQTQAAFNDTDTVAQDSQDLEARVQVDFLGAVTGIDLLRDTGSGQSGFAVGGGCEAAGASKFVSAGPTWNGTSYDVTYELRVRNNLPSTGTLAAAVLAAETSASSSEVTGLPTGIPLSGVTLQDQLADSAFSAITVNNVVNATGALVTNPNYDGLADDELLLPGSVIDAETDELIELTVSYTPDLSTGDWDDCAVGHVYSNQSTVTATASTVQVSDVSDDGVNPAPADDNGAGGVDDPTIVTFPCPPAGLDIVKTVVPGPAGTCPTFALGTVGPGTALQVTDTDVVTYCMSVQNSGPSSATAVVVTDAQAPASFNGAIGTLAGGAEATVSFDIAASLETSATLNTAFANGQGPDGALPEVSDQALIAINPLPSPVLDIVKTVIPAGDTCPADFAGGTPGVGPTLGVLEQGIVTYCLSVINTGPGAATNVVVADPQAGDANPFTIAALAPGAQQQLTYNIVATLQTPTLNVATVTGDGPYGPVPDASDDAQIQVNLRADPVLEIVKTVVTGPAGTCPTFIAGTPGAGPPLSVTYGQTVTYCISVLNSGLGDATGVVITDGQAPAAFDGNIGDLASDAEATVSFDVLIDAQTPQTNTATATGQGVNGQVGPVSDDAVIVATPQPNPVLEIVKTVVAGGQACPATFADGVPGPGGALTALYGESVTYCITILNSGPTAASAVVVTDPQAPASFDGTVGALAAGAEANVSFSIVVSAATPSVNTATVNGSGPNGTLPSANDVAQITPIPQPDPVLEIVKTVVTGPTGACPIFSAGTPGAGPPLSVSYGDTVTYCVTVLNSGLGDATDVVVADPQAPRGFNGAIGDLTVGAEGTVSFDVFIDAQTPQTNTASAIGQGVNGVVGPVTDDAVIVATPQPNPVLEIVKTVIADGQICPTTFAGGVPGPGPALTALYGETVIYCITARNSGPTDASAVVVTDPQAPASFDGTVGVLAAGDAVNLSFSIVVGADTPAVNTATVNGSGPNGAVPSANDVAQINPQPQPDPILDVVKTVVTGPNGTCPSFIDGTAGVGAALNVLYGDTVTYCMSVLNSGATTATDVVVTDVQAPAGFDGTIGDLAAGAEQPVSFDLVVDATTPSVNIARVNGTGPNGPLPEDNDEARINASPIPDPVLEIVKTAVFGANATCPSFDDGIPGLGNPVNALYGDSVTFCLSVKNTGQRPATDVVVSDPQAPAGFNGAIGQLDVDAEATRQFSLVVNASTPGTNVARVTGTGPNGPLPTDSDEARISPSPQPDPVLEIVKTAVRGPQAICPDFDGGTPDLGAAVTFLFGETVTYCISVRNTGVRPASQVAVTDAQAPASFDGTVGALDVAQEVSLQFDLTVAADTPDVNTAIVTGVGPNGDLIPDDDAARISAAPQPDPVLEIVKTVIAGPNGVCPTFSDGTFGQGQAFATTLLDTVTYCLAVKNTGQRNATQVVITDPQAPAGFDGAVGDLAVDAEVLVQFDLQVVEATPLRNIATVNGNGPNGAVAPDSDDALITTSTEPDPLVEIVKTAIQGPDGQCPTFVGGIDGLGPAVNLFIGDTVTYCLSVRNSGLRAATAVVVSDPQAPVSFDGAIGVMAVNTEQTLQFDGVVSANTPAINTATVMGAGPNGALPVDVDNARINVLPEPDPILEIVKTVIEGPDGQCPDFAGGEPGIGAPLLVTLGDTVTYCLSVRNTGVRAATAVVVSDPQAAAGFDGAIGVLPINTERTVSFDVVVSESTPPINTAVVEGFGPNGALPADFDRAAIGPQRLPDPVLEIVKSVRVGPGAQCPAFADGDAGPGQPLVALYGSTVTYCMTVLNSGDGDATNVVVTDANAPATFDGAIGNLASGAEATVSFDVVVSATTPTSNTASATGQGPNGPPPTVSDDALVDPTPLPDPVLEIVKSVRVGPGALCPAFADGDAGPGLPVVVSYGSTVTYCMTVLNSGDGDATNVVVTDANAPATFDGAIGDLASGAEATVSFDVVVSATTPTSNTASATGQGPNGPPPSVSDDALVSPTPLPNPVLEIIKTAVLADSVDCAAVTPVAGDGEPLVVTIGESVTFCIVATNSGPTAAQSVVVNDAQADASPWLVGTLEPTESVNLSYTVQVTETTPTTNTAVITGSGPNGPVPSAEDRAIIDPADPPVPAIALTNTVVLRSQDCVDTQEGVDEFVLGVPDEQVRWCFVITNTGNTPLAQITFDNAPLQLADVDALITYAGGAVVLLPGETITFSVDDEIPDAGLLSLGAVSARAAEADGTIIAGLDPVGAQNDAEVGQTSVRLFKLVVGGTITPCGDAAIETEINAGEIVTWCFVVRNTGSVDLRVTQVTDATLGLTVPIPVEDQVLSPGEGVTVSATTAVTEDTQNSASIIATPLQPNGQPFPNPPDVTATATATVNALAADLSITKAVSNVGPVDPDATLTYTLVVSNAGPDPAKEVTVTDVLPAGLTYGDLPTDGWTCAIAAGGRSFDCLKSGDLAVDASVTLTYDVTVDATVARGANLTNTSTTTTETTDPDPTNNTDTATTTTTVVPPPDIPVVTIITPFTPEPEPEPEPEPDEVLPLVVTGAASQAFTSLAIVLVMIGATFVVGSRRRRAQTGADRQ